MTCRYCTRTFISQEGHRLIYSLQCLSTEKKSSISLILSLFPGVNRCLKASSIKWNHKTLTTGMAHKKRIELLVEVKCKRKKSITNPWRVHARSQGGKSSQRKERLREKGAEEKKEFRNVETLN